MHKIHISKSIISWEKSLGKYVAFVEVTNDRNRQKLQLFDGKCGLIIKKNLFTHRKCNKYVFYSCKKKNLKILTLKNRQNRGNWRRKNK